MKVTQSSAEKSTQLYSINDLQEEFNISRITAVRLIQRGFLKSIRIGRAVRIPKSSVVEFIENGGERHLQEPKSEVEK